MAILTGLKSTLYPLERMDVKCARCSAETLSIKWRAQKIIARDGEWKCKSCITAMRNIAVARELGSVRLHSQSGYFEEKTCDGWKRQHVVIYEKHIGRALAPGEVVHHRNEIKTDNSISNLQLMTHAEHTALHNKGGRHSIETIERIRSGIAKARGYKLNPTIANEIRIIKETMGITNSQLAERYQVSMTAIHRVINKKAWN